MLRKILSLSLLVTAALLSVATSTTPAVIEAIHPSPGQSAVPTDAAIAIELAIPVAKSTVKTGAIRLVRTSDGATVAGRFKLKHDGKLIRFLPDRALDTDTDYRLEIDLDALESKGGGRYQGLLLDPEYYGDVWYLTGVVSIPFSTGAGLEVARAFWSEDNQEAVLYFSEPVEGATVTAGHVALFGPSGESIPIDLRLAADIDRLRIIPLRTLDPSLQYRLELGSGIRSRAGTALGAGEGFSVSFDRYDQSLTTDR